MNLRLARVVCFFSRHLWHYERGEGNWDSQFAYLICDRCLKVRDIPWEDNSFIGNMPEIRR